MGRGAGRAKSHAFARSRSDQGAGRPHAVPWPRAARHRHRDPQLKARWDAVNAELAAIAARRDRTPEGDEVGERERALLEELDRIEGLAGGLQRRE